MIKTCRNRQVVLNNYIGSQNIKLTKEVVVPSLRQFQTDSTLFATTKIKHWLKDIKKIGDKHEQEGIMRRNKLLIEHIWYQRYKNRADEYQVSSPSTLS